MWIRRTDLEIAQFDKQQARKRKSLTRPMFWGAVWAGVALGLQYIGFRGSLRGGFAIASTSRPISLGFAISFFLIVTAFIYYRQRRGLKFFDSIDDALLCNHCFEPSSPNSRRICVCGGRLEPYEYYRWEEDEVQPQMNPSREPQEA